MIVIVIDREKMKVIVVVVVIDGKVTPLCHTVLFLLDYSQQFHLCHQSQKIFIYKY